jgi:hypothetical protein
VTPVRHIFRWDLDKTYLRTDFDSFRSLLRTAIESATEKRAVPGAPALLRALRAAGGPAHRICIISGSPEQMRQVLVAKLALDGVEFDEFVLKPNLRNLLRGRFRALRSQIPYKLPALLASRLATPGNPGETLFGDDAESDAIVYSVHADLLAGRIDRNAVRDILAAASAYEDQLAHTLALAGEIQPHAEGVVKRILIHLDRRSPTARFDRFGPRLVPIYNYFQAALVLWGDGQLAARDVLAVAREMLASRDYTLDALANSLQDLLRSRRLEREAAKRLAGEALELSSSPAREEWSDLPPVTEIAQAFLQRARSLDARALADPPRETRMDYVALLEEEKAHKKSRR